MPIARLKNALTDIFFPPLCIACAKELRAEEKKGVVCANCVAKIPLYDAFVCPVCLKRMPEATKKCHTDALYALAAATHYENKTVQKLIWHCKYKRWLKAAEPISTLFVQYLRALPHAWNTYTIIPLPLHKTKEWDRGFNQAAVIGRAISTSLNIPIIEKALMRVRETKPQAEQPDYGAREKNIEHAFHIAQPEACAGKNILLIDDVTTSGATLREAARVLQSAGARNIVGAVIARAR